MGRPKQLLPLNGIPLIEHSLKTLAASGGRNRAVAGALLDELVPIGSKYQAKIVRNPDSAGDMASSVLSGLRAAGDGATGILIHPADYPCVQPETVAVLIYQHEQNPHEILIPVYQNRRGHPALFPRILLGVGEANPARCYPHIPIESGWFRSMIPAFCGMLIHRKITQRCYAREALNKCLRGRSASLRGAQNPRHTSMYTAVLALRAPCISSRSPNSSAFPQQNQGGEISG